MTEIDSQTEEVGLIPTDDFDFDKEAKHDDGIVLDRTPEGFKQRFEKPDNLPIEFWDDETGSFKSEDILSAYNTEKKNTLALRQKLSKGFHNVPETADHYQVEGLDPDSVEDEDMESLQKFKEISYKNGLSQEQFNSLLSDFKESFPYNTEEPGSNEERVQTLYKQEMEKLGDNAQKYIDSIRSWGRSMVMSKAISKEDYGVLTNMAVTADEVKLIDKLKGISGFITDIPIVESVGNLDDEAEIQRLIADPKYDSDKIMQRKVENYFKNKYKD